MTKASNKILFNKNKRAMKAQMPDQSICPYCNAFMFKATESSYSLVSIDHIQAYSLGGDDNINNLIACCANCNTKKGNNTFAILFKLEKPQELKDHEYVLLNDFINVTKRIEYLKSIKEAVISFNIEQGITLSMEAEDRGFSKSFFAKLTRALQNNNNQDYLVKEVVVRLKAELDKLSSINEQINHIKFTTYSIK